jgi:hypothetical protein
MAVSTNLTDVNAYQGFVREYAQDIISRSFYGNQTADIATPHSGVKGKKVLTQLTLETLGRRFNKTFNPPANTVKFSPRELSVERGKFELQIQPHDFYDSYLGEFHRGTFNSTDEFPFESYVMMKVAEKQSTEIERAWWAGDKAASPASTDALTAVINGWLTLITDDLAAGTPKLTAVATSGGTLTTSNTIQTMEAMFDALDPVLQSTDFGVFVSPKVFSLYQRQYRNDYSKNTDNAQNGRMKLDFCDGELIRTPGMGSSSRIIMTPKENLHYGYDGITDASAFNFEKDHRNLDYWCDFLFGVEFGIFEQGWIVVNDLA